MRGQSKNLAAAMLEAHRQVVPRAASPQPLGSLLASELTPLTRFLSCRGKNAPTVYEILEVPTAITAL